MDTEDDYKRQRWEEENTVECIDCGETVELGAPYLYGDDADGNRGQIRRDIDEDHNCLGQFSTEKLMTEAEGRRDEMENR